jgi:UDP-N-acetylmuramyl pentapeptide phosphotransferase/UDP-N-acetylglucosamine-1-phosphate transferase
LAFVAALALRRPVEWLLTRWGALRPNFRGDRIVTAYGLLEVLAASPALLVYAAAAGPAAGAPATAAAGLVIGFGLLGLADDLFGDRRQTGLRGHVRALVVDRRVTTGLVKAAGGLALSIAVARAALDLAWPNAVAAGLVVALSANAMNLLDLRPGRMCACFLLAAAVLLVAAVAAETTGAAWALAMVALPAAVAYRRDARAEVMLGDTGSNALGAALGLTYVQVAPLLPSQAAVVALLLLLHVAAERWSLTALIESKPLLRRLDACTGVRGPRQDVPHRTA